MKLILSLHPFFAMGGGELYTAAVWRVMAGHDREWRLAVPLAASPDQIDNETILLVYSIADDGDITVGAVPFGQLLMEVTPWLTHLWVHQFAASTMIYELCFSVSPKARVYLTNLGYELIWSEFCRVCGHLPNLRALEISEYSARRTNSAGLRSNMVTAGIWREELQQTEIAHKTHDFISVGRGLPHKGFDITVQALPQEYSLTIIGNFELDRTYGAYLRKLAQGKNVAFTGKLDHPGKCAMLAESRFLVASSTHLSYDGKVYTQVELLGLVIFEALANRSLPLTSDIPSFLEVMQILQLEDLTYPEGNVQALRELMLKSAGMNDDEYEARLESAILKMTEHFLWDDYPQRFERAISETTT